MKILLPTDGSDLALTGVRHALQLVREGLTASVVLANVQAPASLYEMVVAHDPEVLGNISGAAGRHALEAAQALCEAAEVSCETEIGEGDPAHTLIEIAERYGCNMIVMGARGAGGVRTALLGSVADAVLRASSVPVTIVKPLQDELGDDALEEGADREVASSDAR